MPPGGGWPPPGQPGPPGAPGPYGGPPQQPGGGGKIAAIVVGAVLVVALIAGGGWLLLGSDDSEDDKADDKQSSAPADDSDSDASDGGGSDGGAGSGDVGGSEGSDGGADGSDTEYRLSYPRTLEDGKYKRVQDLSDSVQSEQAPPGTKSHLGKYAAKSSDTKQLLYAGISGDDGGDPDNTMDSMLRGMEQGEGMSTAVQRKEITPEGGSEPLTCKVMVKSQSGQKLTIPVCAWSNPGTGAYIAEDSLETYRTKPQEFDLEGFAERVDAIRDEVRTPVG